LQIAIHQDDGITGCMVDGCAHRRLMAKVARERDNAQT
jgi:hypothetical protein